MGSLVRDLSDVPPAPLRDPGESMVAFQRRAFFNRVIWDNHSDLELTLVLEGHGTRGIADSLEEYEAGDLCLLGEGTPHGWEGAACGRVRAFVVHFPLAFLSSCQSIPELRGVGGLVNDARSGLVIGGHTRDAVAHEIMALFAAPATSWRRPLHLMAALSAAAGGTDTRRLAGPSYQRGAHAVSDPRLHRVLAYINGNMCDEITHGQAAAAAGLTGAAFSRFFRRHTGRTFEAYVAEARISRACRMLLEGNGAVTDIAFGVGFNSISHFNSRFRRAKGMTPTAYRTRGLAGSARRPAPPQQ